MISESSSLASAVRPVQQSDIEILKNEKAKLAQKAKTNELILPSLNDSEKSASSDTVDVGINDLYKGLTVLGREILTKLDELLAEELPGGIASLNPNDQTPDKVSDRIVAGVTGLLPLYQAQNPELEGEALIDAFMKEVNKGIDEGYADAIEILEGLGAFEVEGVREGLEETMRLVDEKLARFKQTYLEQLQPKEESVKESTSQEATTELLTGAGSNVVAQASTNSATQTTELAVAA